MNISTVANNLRNTIAGKEELLTNLKGKRIPPEVTINFLEINIAELKRILQDVEVCVKQASDDTWITNPDRMGGGGWTADELDPNRGWK
jgi:hypothetical protein